MNTVIPLLSFAVGVFIFVVGGVIASSTYQNSLIKVCATKGQITIDSVVIKCEIQKDTK